MGVNERETILKVGLSSLFSGSIFIVLELLSLTDISRLDEAICNPTRQQWLKILELFGKNAKLHHPHILHRGPSDSLWIIKNESELRWIATRMPSNRNVMLVNYLGCNPIPSTYYSELHYAARRFDDPSIIRLLVKRKGAVELNTQDHFGRTPLHIACQYGNEWAARALVQLGASVHILNSYGFTPEGSGYANGHRFPLYEPICYKKVRKEICKKMEEKEHSIFPSLVRPFCYY